MADADQVLLDAHCPAYYFDVGEKLMPLSYAKRLLTKRLIKDQTCAGVVTRSGGRTFCHYFLYYENDGGIMEAFDINIGGHKYDVEHMVVEVNSGGDVVGVLYRPHSAKYHFWIKGHDDLSQILVGGDRPKCYVSLGKHAQYPVSGVIARSLVLTDICRPQSFIAYEVVKAEPNVYKGKVDGVLESLSSRLSKEWLNAPTSDLEDVRTRMIFMF